MVVGGESKISSNTYLKYSCLCGYYNIKDYKIKHRKIKYICYRCKESVEWRVKDVW